MSYNKEQSEKDSLKIISLTLALTLAGLFAYGIYYAILKLF